MYCIVPGGAQFRLKNNGRGTCAVPYEGGFVQIGGCCNHGKVDRLKLWSKCFNSLFLILDMMWMVNTWARCPTSTLWDSITRALLLPRQRENRLLSWKLLLLCLDLLSGAFLKTFCNFDSLLFQGLIVAGGSVGKSTEVYLPSTNKWTVGGALPR